MFTSYFNNNNDFKRLNIESRIIKDNKYNKDNEL